MNYREKLFLNKGGAPLGYLKQVHNRGSPQTNNLSLPLHTQSNLLIGQNAKVPNNPGIDASNGQVTGQNSQAFPPLNVQGGKWPELPNPTACCACKRKT